MAGEQRDKWIVGVRRTEVTEQVIETKTDGASGALTWSEREREVKMS